MGAIEDLGASLLYRVRGGVNQAIVAGKYTGWAKSAGTSPVNMLQGTPADQPTVDVLNGINIVKLADATDYLEDPANPDMGGLTGWTNIVVCFYQSNGIAANQPIRAPANSLGCGITSHNLSSQYCKVGLDYGGISKTTGWHIVAAIFDGNLIGNAARLKMYLDMTPMVVTFSGTIPPVQTTPTLGSRIGWPGLSGVGDKNADDVMVNRPLTQAELLTCVKQLAQDYNLPLAGYLVQPTPGIASAEAFGGGSLITALVQPGPGIASAEAFGGGTLGDPLVQSPPGIPSAEAFGTATAHITDALIQPAPGIPSEEAFGGGRIGDFDMALVRVQFPFVDGLTGNSDVLLEFPSDGIITLDAGGVKVIADPRVTALSRIMVTAQDGGVVPQGNLYIAARTVGVGFTIQSTNAADAGVVVYYQIWEATS